PWPVARDLCACFGVALAPTAVVDDTDGALRAAASLGYPVALKVAAAAVVHKTDVGGVRLGLADEAAVREAFAAMRSELGASFTGALVQPMPPDGGDAFVGA